MHNSTPSPVDASADDAHIDNMAFFTGYHDCKARAVQYLIENENFADDDPLILGLKRQLDDYYEQFQNDSIEVTDPVEMTSFLHGEQSPHHSHQYQPNNTPNYPTITDSCEHHICATGNTGCIYSEANHTSDTFEVQSHEQSLESSPTNPLTSTPTHQLHSPTDFILSLSNNPAIASLYEEIKSLLDEEDMISTSLSSEGDSGINDINESV